VVGALSKKTDAMAFVMTRDGELRQRKLEGAGPVRQAQAQAIKFNALVHKIDAAQLGPCAGAGRWRRRARRPSSAASGIPPVRMHR
jgi:hypothetical protein